MGISHFIDKKIIPTFGSEFADEKSDNEQINSTVWTTELVEDLIQKVEEYGLDLDKVKHPFFEKNINVRRARIAFQMSDYELNEFKKCRKDIIYFANTYVKLMQEHGIDNITLYPYQEEMLRSYTGGKYNIVLGSRQIGKCLISSTLADLDKQKVQLHRIYFRNKKQKTILDYLKYGLYRIYDWLS